jgi:hypothetical protein
MIRFKTFSDNCLYASSRNVLVGGNNSGKTSILHALRLFFYAVSNEFSGPVDRLHFHKRYIAVDDILPVSDSKELWTDCKRGHSIALSVSFESGLTIEALFSHRFGQVHVSAVVKANPNRLNGEQINDAVSHNLAFIPGLVGILPHEPYVTPGRRTALSVEARYSEMYRSSLFHLQKDKPRAIKDINKVLKEYLEAEISDIDFDSQNDVYAKGKFTKDGVLLDLANAGSGMLQIIQLLVNIYLHAPTLLLIDEPDAHLHPELQEKIGPILRTVAEKMNAQVFVATHSPDVIDSFDPKEVFFIDATKTDIRPVKEDSEFVEGLIGAGIISNSSLTRIAVRPRCLVLEDKDLRMFRVIDSVLSSHLFEHATDYHGAEGVSKFEAIQQVYTTVQSVVGRKIDLRFIQDRDGLAPRYVGYVEARYKDKGMTVFVLERHEIENYLLDAKILRAALKNKGLEISLAKCRSILTDAAKGLKAYTRGQIRRRCTDTNRLCGRPESYTDAAVEADVNSWFDGLSLDERTILQVFPGKELLREIRRIIEESYAIDLRVKDLLDALTRDRLADDIKRVFGWASNKQVTSG